MLGVTFRPGDYKNKPPKNKRLPYYPKTVKNSTSDPTIRVSPELKAEGQARIGVHLLPLQRCSRSSELKMIASGEASKPLPTLPLIPEAAPAEVKPNSVRDMLKKTSAKGFQVFTNGEPEQVLALRYLPAYFGGNRRISFTTTSHPSRPNPAVRNLRTIRFSACVPKLRWSQKDNLTHTTISTGF